MDTVELFFLIQFLKGRGLWDILQLILICMEEKLKECEFIFPAITITTHDFFYNFFYSDGKSSRVGVQDPSIYLSLIKPEEDIEYRQLYPDGIYSHLCDQCATILQDWRETCNFQYYVESPPIDDETCFDPDCSIKYPHITTFGVFKYKKGGGEIRYSMSIDLLSSLKHDCFTYGWRDIILRVFGIGMILFDIKNEGKCGIYYSPIVQEQFQKKLLSKK